MNESNRPPALRASRGLAQWFWITLSVGILSIPFPGALWVALLPTALVLGIVWLAKR